jgi:hypothetical protein
LDKPSSWQEAGPLEAAAGSSTKPIRSDYVCEISRLPVEEGARQSEPVKNEQFPVQPLNAQREVASRIRVRLCIAQAAKASCTSTRTRRDGTATLKSGSSFVVQPSRMTSLRRDV